MINMCVYLDSRHREGRDLPTESASFTDLFKL